MDVALKGVQDGLTHELGVRTVDDLGIVGASIDQVRVARNLDSVNGRMGNIISEPALKYGIQSAENSNKLFLVWLINCIKQVRSGWKVVTGRLPLRMWLMKTRILLSRWSIHMFKADIRKVLEPHIVRKLTYWSAGRRRFRIASRALSSSVQRSLVWIWLERSPCFWKPFWTHLSDAEGARLMHGTPAVKVAQDKIIDLMQYVTQLTASAILQKP